MAHYAQIENNKVVNVIVADNTFINQLPGTWVQTSYNTRGGVHYNPLTSLPDGGVPLRKNYAGVGFTYDEQRDAFIPPKPYTSWVLNENTCLWEPPTPYPNDGQSYKWDENTQTWVIVTE